MILHYSVPGTLFFPHYSVTQICLGGRGRGGGLPTLISNLHYMPNFGTLSSPNKDKESSHACKVHSSLVNNHRSTGPFWLFMSLSWDGGHQSNPKHDKHVRNSLIWLHVYFEVSSFEIFESQGPQGPKTLIGAAWTSPDLIQNKILWLVPWSKLFTAGCLWCLPILTVNLTVIFCTRQDHHF